MLNTFVSLTCNAKRCLIPCKFAFDYTRYVATEPKTDALVPRLVHSSPRIYRACRGVAQTSTLDYHRGRASGDLISSPPRLSRLTTAILSDLEQNRRTLRKKEKQGQDQLQDLSSLFSRGHKKNSSTLLDTETRGEDRGRLDITTIGPSSAHFSHLISPIGSRPAILHRSFSKGTCGSA